MIDKLPIHGSSHPSVLNVLILEREENRSTRRKTLEAQERSTTIRNSTHMSHQPTKGTHRTWLGFFSGERHNALSAWPPVLIVL